MTTCINQGAQLPPSDVALVPTLRVRYFLPKEGSRLSFGGARILEPAHSTDRAFTGALENQPHNLVHGRIGGTEGWMSDANTAAQDPIFWPHHSNIDRLWERWLDRGDGRANPVGDAVWMATGSILRRGRRQDRDVGTGDR